jgi:hypothetical protein
MKKIIPIIIIMTSLMVSAFNIDSGLTIDPSSNFEGQLEDDVDQPVSPEVTISEPVPPRGTRLKVAIRESGILFW